MDVLYSISIVVSTLYPFYHVDSPPCNAATGDTQALCSILSHSVNYEHPSPLLQRCYW